MRLWRIWISLGLLCAIMCVPGGDAYAKKKARVYPLRIELQAIRDVVYVGEDIRMRILFAYAGPEARMLNISDNVLAQMTFTVTYDGTVHTFHAPRRYGRAPRYIMAGPGEELVHEVSLTHGQPKIGTRFAHRYYGELPTDDAEMAITVHYHNTEKGTRNVVPFWVGESTSEPLTMKMVRKR